MIYEYSCPQHETFEVHQKITDEPLTLCPKCQREGIETPVKKLISLSSFQLVGSGWAKDKYSK